MGSTQPSAGPSTGLPRRLKLLVIELAAITMMAAGFDALFLGEPPYLAKPLGLALVLTGVDLLLRPGARRRVPRLDKLLRKLLDRWRSPPAL